MLLQNSKNVVSFIVNRNTQVRLSILLIFKFFYYFEPVQNRLARFFKPVHYRIGSITKPVRIESAHYRTGLLSNRLIQTGLKI